MGSNTQYVWPQASVQEGLNSQHCFGWTSWGSSRCYTHEADCSHNGLVDRERRIYWEYCKDLSAVSESPEFTLYCSYTSVDMNLRGIPKLQSATFSWPWLRLHADFAGTIQGSMLLIVIDAHSKWIEAHPLTTITSTTTSRCLRKIFASFGVLESLVTDNGPSFVSEEF